MCVHGRMYVYVDSYIHTDRCLQPGSLVLHTMQHKTFHPFCFDSGGTLQLAPLSGHVLFVEVMFFNRYSLHRKGEIICG